MSIIIEGMEIPKENDYTIVIVYGDGVVTEYHEDYWIRGADGEKQIGTAIPVPEHGRLIDADALMLEIQEYIEEYGWETDEHGWHNEKWCAMKEVAMAIDAAPTIIEAEEGET